MSSPKRPKLAPAECSASPCDAPTFDRLPAELLELVLLNVNLPDFARIACTCRHLADFVRRLGGVFWKHLLANMLLQPVDEMTDPPSWQSWPQRVQCFQPPSRFRNLPPDSPLWRAANALPVVHASSVYAIEANDFVGYDMPDSDRWHRATLTTLDGEDDVRGFEVFDDLLVVSNHTTKRTYGFDMHLKDPASGMLSTVFRLDELWRVVPFAGRKLGWYKGSPTRDMVVPTDRLFWFDGNNLKFPGVRLPYKVFDLLLVSPDSLACLDNHQSDLVVSTFWKSTRSRYVTVRCIDRDLNVKVLARIEVGPADRGCSIRLGAVDSRVVVLCSVQRTRSVTTFELVSIHSRRQMPLELPVASRRQPSLELPFAVSPTGVDLEASNSGRVFVFAHQFPVLDPSSSAMPLYCFSRDATLLWHRTVQFSVAVPLLIVSFLLLPLADGKLLWMMSHCDDNDVALTTLLLMDR
eukprot:TRINITY_DN1432_c0_g3_i1.p1 TRINITY_DN1432_c0_g3~~TRINITY_DN1432_c0_g3_i1.p1  ORF type:complete len:465 (-),score=67.23 TRINITY_DN1432_c0_g3_i1:101-1495(-)